MKPQIIATLRVTSSIGVSVFALIWAFHDADFHAIRDILSSMSIGWGALAAALFVTSVGAHATRTELLVRHNGQRIGFPRLIRTHFVGLLWDIVLPAQLGTDSVRAGLLRKKTLGSAIRPLFLDRVAGFVSLGILSIVAMGYSWTRFEQAWGSAATGYLTAMTVVLLIGGVLYGAKKRTGTWPQRLFFLSSLALVQGVCLSLALATMSVAFHLPIDPLAVGLSFSIIALGVLAIPFSVGGTGVREALFPLVLMPLGVSSNGALALAAGWFFLGRVVGIMGVLGLGLGTAASVGVSPQVRDGG